MSSNSVQAQVSENTQEATRESRSGRRKSASAFRTISEVAGELDVQQHVLRFWETKFSQIRPLKRGGGRRYYRPEDVALLKKIHELLYTEGYTIKGVQKLLKEHGKNHVLSEEAPGRGAEAVAELNGETASLNEEQRQVLEATLGELKELRRLIKTEG